MDPVPVVVVVSLMPLEGRRAELVEVCQRNSRRVVNLQVGCRHFVIDDRGPDGPVVVLTKWDSEDDLALHLLGPTAAANVESFVGLLAAPMIPRIVPLHTHDALGAAEVGIRALP